MGRKKSGVSPNEIKQTLNFLLDSIVLHAKNESQKKFLRMIDEKEITVASGPSGVGKSMISVFKALQLLKNPDNQYYKIKVTTPAVEAHENHGFLPGDINDKMAPYLNSTFELFTKIIDKRTLRELREGEFIEVWPFAFMRGANVDNTIVIAEECQNATPEQMKTIVTRIGYNSKYIISGDLEQSDRYKDAKKSGLSDILLKLTDIDEIGMFEFNEGDIVRNPLIGKILQRYKP